MKLNLNRITLLLPIHLLIYSIVKFLVTILSETKLFLIGLTNYAGSKFCFF